MTTGNLSQAINSDVVKLSIGASGELITLFDIDYGVAPPRNRRSTRAGKLDTYGPPLIDFWASATVSKDVHDQIDGLATQNSRRAYTVETFTIVGENLGGNVANDTSVAFSGEVPEYRVLAPGNGVDMTIRFHVIVDNSTYP